MISKQTVIIRRELLVLKMFYCGKTDLQSCGFLIENLYLDNYFFPTFTIIIYP